MKRFGILFLAAFLGSILTVAVTYWVQPQYGLIQPSNQPTVTRVSYSPSSASPPFDFTVPSEKVLPSVVHIKSISERQQPTQQAPDAFRFFFDQPNMSQQPSQSSGSGVIINASGYIVTNNHVVDGAELVEVTLSDNRTLKAEVVGTDPDTDLAVIKINEKNLPFLSMINSDDAKVGQWVLAVGNPFNLNSTVTAGIISAKGRNINIINQGNQNNTAIESFIQTDAAINPGNSGGALVNMDGGLIGINTAIASPTGSYSGYGFAIPSNIVGKVVEDIISFGTVQRGWLGIQIQDVTASLAKEHGLHVSEGAYVIEFPEKSAAKEAGIKKGDVIVKIDNQRIQTNTHLIGYIGSHRPGDKVKVYVNREGKEHIYDVILKNKDGNIARIKADEKTEASTLGVEFENIDEKILRQMDLISGVKVSQILNGKIKKYTDMRKGFIVTHIDNVPVKSVTEVNAILKKKKTGDQVIFGGQYENYPREYLFALRM